MFSSAIQVIHQSTDRIEIIDPPRYSAAIGAIALAIIFLWVFISRKRPDATLSWLQIAIPVGMLAIGMIFLASRTRITLSRPAGSLLIEKQFLGMSLSNSTIPLSDIRNAFVESRSGPRRKVMLLQQDGGIVPLGQFTGQEGHYAAAKAINDFLGVATEQKSK